MNSRVANQLIQVRNANVNLHDRTSVLRYAQERNLTELEQWLIKNTDIVYTREIEKLYV